jgi:hypothetical protein
MLLNFSFNTSSWSVSLYGGNAASLSAPTVAAATGITQTTIAITQIGTYAATGINGITQVATSNTMWFISHATSGVSSVGSTLGSTATLTFLQGGFVSSLATFANTNITGTTATSVVTNVALNALGTTTISCNTTTLLPFSMQYTGVSSSIPALVYPDAFNNGILSTNATVASIAVTAAAMISTGSTALLEPWIALVGA